MTINLTIPFIIFLILFILKLAQIGLVADLSWVWVTAPLWAVAVVIMVWGLLLAWRRP